MTTQCSFNLHFSYDEQSWASFYRFQILAFVFRELFVYISSSFFYMAVGFFSYSVFRSSLFICGINSRYFFSRNHLLCFFLYMQTYFVFMSNLSAFCFIGSGF